MDISVSVGLGPNTQLVIDGRPLYIEGIEGDHFIVSTPGTPPDRMTRQEIEEKIVAADQISIFHD